MLKSRKTQSVPKTLLILVLGGLLAHWASEMQSPDIPIAARSVEGELGDFKGQLDFLRRHHTGPQAEGENNHFIDLWSPSGLAATVRAGGLTNNHALFVDSHGRAGFGWSGGRYGIYPHQDLIPPGQKSPAYSAKDIAAVLGPEAARSIHNILLAGCNAEGRLRSQEFRRYFVNATNITYMTPGKLAFKPMFIQAITLPSSEIRPLHARIREVSTSRIEARISSVAWEGSEPLGTYLADLYQPGGRKPFRTQTAGRELLESIPSTSQASLRPPSGPVAR